MNKKEIKETVRQKTIKLSGKDIPVYSEKYDEEFLTGRYWGLSAREMVYLLYELCSTFQIHIESTDLDSYSFATINRITNVVERKGGKKDEENIEKTAEK